MGSLGPTHLDSVLLAVAISAATCGFIASAVVRRNKRRARGVFLLGFFCGWMAGAILRGRRGGLNAVAAVAGCAVHALTLTASHGLLRLWAPRGDACEARGSAGRAAGRGARGYRPLRGAGDRTTTAAESNAKVKNGGSMRILDALWDRDNWA